MSDKEQLLIIARDEKLPASLQLSIDELELDRKICSMQEVLDKLDKLEATSAVVVSMEEISCLEEESLRELCGQLQKLSINLLVLADEAAGDCQAIVPKYSGIYHALKNESSEMIKGRLAMMLDIRPRLQQMSLELEKLHNFGSPLTSYFSQVDEEMQLAARLQRDFLPRSLPEIEGFKFSCVYRPATWVSGDIYDLMRLDEDHIGFYVADVVGHGMPAALLTMFIKQALATKRITGNSYSLIEPHDALSQLNEDFVDQQLGDCRFATGCYAILNVKTLELRVASAGHPPPIRIDQQGQLTELEVHGSLLGIFPGQEYEMLRITLNRGDKLLLFSDGVEAAFTNNGPDEPLRFRQEFEYLANYDVGTMCGKLVEIIEQEEGSLHPRDDVTIVAMEIQP